MPLARQLWLHVKVALFILLFTGASGNVASLILFKIRRKHGYVHNDHVIMTPPWTLFIFVLTQLWNVTLIVSLWGRGPWRQVCIGVGTSKWRAASPSSSESIAFLHNWAFFSQGTVHFSQIYHFVGLLSLSQTPFPQSCNVVKPNYKWITKLTDPSDWCVPCGIYRHKVLWFLWFLKSRLARGHLCPSGEYSLTLTYSQTQPARCSVTAEGSQDWRVGSLLNWEEFEK